MKTLIKRIALVAYWAIAIGGTVAALCCAVGSFAASPAGTSYLLGGIYTAGMGLTGFVVGSVPGLPFLLLSEALED